MAFLIARGALAAGVVLGLAALSPVQQRTLEDDVKAAFLYNFIRFIDWPADAFAGPSDPFRVCAMAGHDFLSRLDDILRGETTRGRPIIRVTPTPADVASCHVLFIEEQERERGGRLLPLTARGAVLVVGDGPDFLARGAAIVFVLENNRVRFDVNLAAATRARLTVNAKLLRVARRVQEGAE